MTDNTVRNKEVQMTAEVHASLFVRSTWSPSNRCSVATHCSMTTLCGSRASEWTDWEGCPRRLWSGKKHTQSAATAKFHDYFPQGLWKPNVYILNVKNTNPESLQIWLGFTVFGSKANFLSNTPSLKGGRRCATEQPLVLDFQKDSFWDNSVPASTPSSSTPSTLSKGDSSADRK